MTGELQVRGLHKRFGETVALEHCDLTVAPGELVGFLGPNGAGKSTTMRGIMRLLTMDGGTVTWNGGPITDDDRRRIGYMPQERGLYARMRIAEQIEYFGRLAGMDAGDARRHAAELIERVGLSDRADDEVQELSVGNQQRVQLAVALIHRPQLLVLDEPFAGLDPIAIAALRDIIVERTDHGVGVLFSSHQLDVVQELCRHVVVINEGRTIADGDVDDLRASSTRRVLDVSWRESDETTRTWRPSLSGDHLAGVQHDDSLAVTTEPSVEVVTDPAGRRTFRVPAGVDVDTLMAQARAVGVVERFRFEPPDLDELFTELVGTRRVSADDRHGGEPLHEVPTDDDRVEAEARS